jgi:hypothetical protein
MKKVKPFAWKKHTNLKNKVWFYNGHRILTGEIYKKESEYEFTILDYWKTLNTNIKHFYIKPFTSIGRLELLEIVLHHRIFNVEQNLKNVLDDLNKIKQLTLD